MADQFILLRILADRPRKAVATPQEIASSWGCKRIRRKVVVSRQSLDEAGWAFASQKGKWLHAGGIHKPDAGARNLKTIPEPGRWPDSKIAAGRSTTFLPAIPTASSFGPSAS